ncbi:septum formation protein Maf [Flavobacteriaceae bacterium Ap0902]|nr:septum formation protein Maf [Flavobacteriaceae bacterium Ap0902]
MLADKFKNHRIILASQSPRRKELLKGLDISFMTMPLHVDESYPTDLKGEEITAYLCHKKAEAYQNWQPNDILITADTIVWKDERALEKPRSIKEAKEMIYNLQNNKHTVISSVGIFSPEKHRIFSDTVQVTFGKISQEEIDYYVDKYRPLDKAGAYGVQEWIGYIGVKRMEGSYYTVMGLPVYPLYHELKDF